MKRSEWQKAKADAAKLNGNKPVKFAKDLNLGPALDTFHAAEKKLEATNSFEKPKAYLTVGAQWLAARQKVLLAATAYAEALNKNQAQGEAAARAKLSMALTKLLNVVSAQRAAKAETVTKNIARIKAGAATK